MFIFIYGMTIKSFLEDKMAKILVLKFLWIYFTDTTIMIYDIFFCIITDKKMT